MWRDVDRVRSTQQRALPSVPPNTRAAMKKVTFECYVANGTATGIVGGTLYTERDRLVGERRFVVWVIFLTRRTKDTLAVNCNLVL